VNLRSSVDPIQVDDSIQFLADLPRRQGEPERRIVLTLKVILNAKSKKGQELLSGPSFI
jgi:hypothetical protein